MNHISESLDAVIDDVHIAELHRAFWRLEQAQARYRRRLPGGLLGSFDPDRDKMRTFEEWCDWRGIDLERR